MGHFITFEGTEGCGKTTQIIRAAAHLQQRGFTIVPTREPGGCELANRIRAILLDPNSRHMVPSTELLLYAAARAQHIDEVIRPALQQGKIVLCDRFCDATLAYQGYGRQLPLDAIHWLNHFACGDIVPHLTLWLDLPLNLGLERAQERNASQQLENEQRFEQESLNFHQRVQNGYEQLRQQHPRRIQRISAEGSVDQVAHSIATCLDRYFSKV
ncbi:MAG: dTMP kinase [Desulfuromonadaceae bacterium]|nr:dTMP kinase [Desulfuromonadaceae bacterium]